MSGAAADATADPGWSADDLRHMDHALALGRRQLGRTWPNPSVGCVLVRAGRIVGRGATQPGGRPHAERVALSMAGEAAQGATAYVTLEPCAHTGLTPPCTDALIASGVARVVVATGDIDDRVSGRGIAQLEAAGIAVEVGCRARMAERDHAGFMLNRTLRRPLVTLKLASSFDGRIATATGESRWITGPAARRVVHGLRANHDAVLVGAGTARADDPMLDVRDMGPVSQPVRIVASRHLDLPLLSSLARSAGQQPLWLCHGPRVSPESRSAWEGLGARSIEVPMGSGALDPNALLRALGQEGLTRVLCEGGGALAATLLAAGLVDRLMLFSAGLALGAEGTPGIGALGLGRLADAPRFVLEEVRALGPDTLSVWSRADL